jgi:hypothetical protein
MPMSLCALCLCAAMCAKLNGTEERENNTQMRGQERKGKKEGEGREFAPWGIMLGDMLTSIIHTFRSSSLEWLPGCRARERADERAGVRRYTSTIQYWYITLVSAVARQCRCACYVCYACAVLSLSPRNRPQTPHKTQAGHAAQSESGTHSIRS